MQLQLTIYLVTVALIKTTVCEQFTSIDELSRWSRETLKTFDRLDEVILKEEIKLNNLRHVRDSLMPVRREVQVKQLIDPVQIFIVLNRLYKAIDLINVLSTEIQSSSLSGDDGQSSNPETSDTHDEYRDQIHEELRGSGSALLRLQNFYGLNVSNLIAGSVTSDGSHSFRMNADDCFRLGQIAYRDEQYGLAIVWLHASLDLVMRWTQVDEQLFSISGELLVDDILDHMAFAAYKLKLFDYAIRLTRAWLERDPENERARENLAYYIEEIKWATTENDQPEASERSPQNLTSDLYYENYKDIAIDSYQVENDAVIRRLCRQMEPIPASTGKCLTGPNKHSSLYFFPGSKIEILNEDPRIIRIHDVITQHEAEYLQSIARPRLSRSTIMLSNSQQASNFRIAKTAWLESSKDVIVAQIENRLSAILDLNMDGSELLQVVNYGIGGFYGPHLDTSRTSNTDGVSESDLIDQLARSDRYATILLYLNDVQIGGSTVFPVLNLSVPPVARSAVVWLNILDDGYADERTLHTGCPVSLGSKWIAVKWPREAANSFSKGHHWWWQDPRVDLTRLVSRNSNGTVA